MVGTIISVVHRDNIKGLAPRLLSSHAFGYLLSSASVGAGLATIGSAARIRYALGGTAVWVIVCGGVLLGSRDLGLVSFPIPQRRWQVPARWRSLAIAMDGLCVRLGPWSRLCNEDKGKWVLFCRAVVPCYAATDVRTSSYDWIRVGTLFAAAVAKSSSLRPQVRRCRRE
jgi:hypothetical protein